MYEALVLEIVVFSKATISSLTRFAYPGYPLPVKRVDKKNKTMLTDIRSCDRSDLGNSLNH